MIEQHRSALANARLEFQTLFFLNIQRLISIDFQAEFAACTGKHHMPRAMPPLHSANTCSQSDTTPTAIWRSTRRFLLTLGSKGTYPKFPKTQNSEILGQMLDLAQMG